VCQLRVEKKKNNWGPRISPIFFSGYSCFRTKGCCGYLTSYKKVLIYKTHIKKVIAKLFFYSERQNKWQAIIGQKFRLTPVPSLVGLKLDAHGRRPMRFLSACVWFRDVTSFSDASGVVCIQTGTCFYIDASDLLLWLTFTQTQTINGAIPCVFPLDLVFFRFI